MSNRLSKRIIECFLVEIVPIIQGKQSERPFDWMSKDITVQLVKVFLEDALSNICQKLLQSADCDDKWKLYLTELRHYLWPESANDDTLRRPQVEGYKKACVTTDGEAQFQPNRNHNLINGTYAI